MNPRGPATYESMGLPPPKKIKKPPYGGRPKFVKFAPGDTGEHLPHVFFEDPRTFAPLPGPLREIHAWGLYPYVLEDEEISNEHRTDDLNWPSFDGVQAMMRQMNTQMIYMGGNVKTPESQFMKVVLDRKRQNLKSVDLGGLDKCDVLIRIYIASMRDRNGKPRVWRRFKVSAGIGLSAFQDKVVAPIMGWVRNMHCYTFTDYRDGSLYGPANSDSIDRMHIAQVGYEYLPDDKYKLAHSFGKAGDRIGYLYDFGDKWFHNIEIERVYSPGASTGAIEILEGQGMWPGENLHGSLQYSDFLNKYEKATVTEKYKQKKEILETPNYNAFGKPPSQFDPFAFDLNAANERLAEALGAPSSVRSGSKKFTMPMVPGGEGLLSAMNGMHLKKGQTIKKQHDAENFGFWDETVSNTKDSRKIAVCASCGKPAANNAELKTCSGCRQVLYCCPEHQKAHWKASHKRQCTRQFVSEQKGEETASTSK